MRRRDAAYPETDPVAAAAAAVRRRDPAASQARIRLLCCLADAVWRQASGETITGLVWSWAPFAPYVARDAGSVGPAEPPVRHRRGEREALSLEKVRLVEGLTDRFLDQPLPVLAAAARAALARAEPAVVGARPGA
jgi:hypothetical protein